MRVHTHDPSKARRGFTLAELVIVMVIISTLAAIAVPRFASADASYRARGAAERFADTIRDAALTARSRSTTVVFRVDTSSDAVNAVITSTSETIASYATSDSPFGADASAFSLAKGSELQINGFGEFSASAVYVLRVGGQSRTIIVDSGAGTVTVGDINDGKTFRSSARFK